MRYRIWAVIGVMLLTVALSSCGTLRVARSTVGTPVPTKTLRPTFTNTPARPALTPSPMPSAPMLPAPTALPATATPEASAATIEPPTAAPPTATATSDAASLTVTNASVNVRSGPGTNYANIGRASRGQSFVVTGKNPTGDWYQFDFNGKPGWVIGQLVEIQGGERVQVAANILPPPTAAPRPTARPQPVQPKPQPTQPPAAASLFAQAYTESRSADDANFQWVTFWGRLGKPPETPPGGYRLRVNAPSGTKEIPFNTVWEYAYTGQPSQFLYDAKVELPRAAGAYRAVVIDGSGNEVSDVFSGTLTDRTHDVIVGWTKR